MKYIDLTQTFTSDTPVFPGDPSATLTQTVFIDKDGNNDHELTTAMHVGTHMDAPLHMIDRGKHIDAFSIDHFFGNGIVIDARGKDKIDTPLLENIIIPKGSIVLVYTGFGEQYRTEKYFTSSPEITEDFAQKMVDLKVKIVGMDTSSPEHNPPWKIHKMLLKQEILILENLTNLDQLLGNKSFEVIALPAKLHADAAPVRVVAKILD